MAIKPLKKNKKKRSQSVGYWSRKADKQMQEIGRAMYNKCLICGGEYSCLHHFYPKSQCTFLRYNIKNLIPICQGCHFSHHNGNPEIHATVIAIKGEEWYEELKALKRNNLYIKAGYAYYRDMYEKLKLIEPVKVK